MSTCEKCGRPMVFKPHYCPPEYEVDVYGCDEWFTVHAFDAQHAAELACEKLDCYNDYAIISDGGCPEVKVRKKDTPTLISLFSITAESVPEYYAKEIPQDTENTQI